MTEQEGFIAAIEYRDSIIKLLTAQIETKQYELDAIPAIKAERDAYAKAADDMAASHKVERDHWYAFQNTQVSLMTEIAARGDALKDAARLALDEMENVTYAVLSGAITVDVLRFERTVSALKAVL